MREGSHLAQSSTVILRLPEYFTKPAARFASRSLRISTFIMLVLNRFTRVSRRSPKNCHDQGFVVPTRICAPELKR